MLDLAVMVGAFLVTVWAVAAILAAAVYIVGSLLLAAFAFIAALFTED